MISGDASIFIARQRLAAEQLLKLDEVKKVNSTAVRLFWKVIFGFIHPIHFLISFETMRVKN